MLGSDLAGGAIIVALMTGAVALWRIPDGRGCDQCPHCQRERDEREREQRELQHDVEHKGMGFQTGAPDRYRCSDEDCRRNPAEAGRRPIGRSIGHRAGRGDGAVQRPAMYAAQRRAGNRRGRRRRRRETLQPYGDQAGRGDDEGSRPGRPKRRRPQGARAATGPR